MGDDRVERREDDAVRRPGERRRHRLVLTTWAEAVFHVLAHVDAGAAPGSCFDPAWIAWAEARLGPASDRALAEDAATLARVLADPDALARAQRLAWTFASAENARAAAGRDLPDATPAEEVLRAAAELELDAIEALGPIDAALDLARVTAAAPHLARCDVAMVRPLPRRGRALGRSILVGAPGIAGAEAWHVAWQAAHEATVLEIGPGAWRDVEPRAIALLRDRARAAGLAADHARWLATLDLSAIGDEDHRAE